MNALKEHSDQPTVDTELAQSLQEQHERVRISIRSSLTIRKNLIRSSQFSASINADIESYTGVPGVYMNDLEDSIKLIECLIPNWKLHEIFPVGDLWGVSVINKNDPNNIMTGRKVTRKPSHGLCALIFQIHIRELIELSVHIKTLFGKHSQAVQLFLECHNGLEMIKSKISKFKISS